MTKRKQKKDSGFVGTLIGPPNRKRSGESVILIGPQKVGGMCYAVGRTLYTMGFSVHLFDPRRGDIQNAKEYSADYTIVGRGRGVPKGLLETLPRPRVLLHAEIIHPDPCRVLEEPVSRVRAQELSSHVHLYDHVFHHNYPALDSIKALGARRAHWTGFAGFGVYPLIHNRVSTHKKYDVGFAGCLSKRRVNALRYLKQNGVPVVVKKVWGREYVRFINECKIFLNIHFANIPNIECRTFEVLGSGTFLITEELSMPELYTNGTHLVSYPRGDIDQLLRDVRYYIRENGEREEIAQSGHEYAHNFLTVNKNINSLLNTVDSHEENAPIA